MNIIYRMPLNKFLQIFTNFSISNPVFMLNYSNGKSTTNWCTNNYAEPIDVARYNAQIDK